MRILKILQLLTIIGLGMSLSSAGHAQQSYFNMTETQSNNLSPFTKWTSVIMRFARQKNVPDGLCGKVRFHPCAIGEWRQLIESLRGRSISQQIETVNTWGNSHPYILDQLNWGINDYWATPFEFMEINGDCEDYAIAKYYTLRAIGVPDARMRIIILQDFNLGGIIHAVLGVYDNDNRLQILDNQSPRVTPALRIYHYRPIYGVNEAGWWAYHPNRS